MPTETKSDRLVWLIPLGLIAILGAAFTGVTLAKSTTPQATKPTTAATSPPNPLPTVTATPEPKTSPTDTPMAQAAPTGWMKVKASPNGCTPAFDSPEESKQQTVCFLAGQVFQVVGEQQNGFINLTDGTNKFWMQTSSLEPTGAPANANATQTGQQDQAISTD